MAYYINGTEKIMIMTDTGVRAIELQIAVIVWEKNI